MRRTSQMSFASDTAVWDRTGTDGMSRNFFAFMVCFWTAAGVALSAVGAALTVNWHPTQAGMIMMSIGVLISGIVGVVIAMKSDNPAI